MTIRPFAIESWCFLDVLLCCALAVSAWIIGMSRKEGFGAWPSAVWITLLSISLLCSATVAVIEIFFARATC